MMKFLILFFALSIAGLLSTAATAGFHKSEDVVNKLSLYKPDALQPEGVDSKSSDLQMDEMFSDLEQASKFSMSTAPSVAAVFEMERVALITSLRDSRFEASLILTETYIKNKKIFSEAAKKLAPKDREFLLDGLQQAERYFHEGDQ